jgi:hypothetical protein
MQHGLGWLVQMFSFVLNWLKELWQSKSKLEVDCLALNSLGNDTGLARASKPYIYEVKVRIRNASTQRYEIERIEPSNSGFACSKLGKVSTLPEPDRFRLGGKSVTYCFSWNPSEVWWPFPFKLEGRDTVTRLLIVEAERQMDGSAVQFIVVGTDRQTWQSKSQMHFT